MASRRAAPHASEAGTFVRVDFSHSPATTVQPYRNAYCTPCPLAMSDVRPGWQLVMPQSIAAPAISAAEAVLSGPPPLMPFPHSGVCLQADLP